MLLGALVALLLWWCFEATSVAPLESFLEGLQHLRREWSKRRTLTARFISESYIRRIFSLSFEIPRTP